ncbi:RloB domain-containing protein [Streptomyces sp. NA02950]|uniref:RloB family protein n=1 Tax=Streptomyces sp. NA02950 TaxID=2742137 RepID=UPI0015906BB6|nr:RloB family protein [Streptomyces sp. NA02950]QKV92453.1 RloB domain-containing protein [Streptomyces sp. NA02950]
MAPKRGRDSAQRTARRSVRRRMVYVFTEGTLTEPSYIDALLALRKDARKDEPLPAGKVESTIEIMWDERTDGGRRGPQRSHRERKPLAIVEAAIAHKKKVTRETRGLEKKYQPSVWCLFDRDDHQGIQRAANMAEQAGVNVAYSHPCFELWRLLHYQNYTTGLGGACGAASGKLRGNPKFVKTYGRHLTSVSEDKAKLVLPEQVRGGYKNAKKFAQKINEEHTSPEREKWDPYTDVWCFVEDGIGLTDY